MKNHNKKKAEAFFSGFMMQNPERTCGMRGDNMFTFTSMLFPEESGSLYEGIASQQKEISQKDEHLSKQDELLRTAVRNLHAKGFSDEEIMDIMGIDRKTLHEYPG